MKEQIQQVQAYFIQKILKGEFTVTDTSEHSINIVIDDEYKFCFWMSSGAAYCEQWIHTDNNFIMFPKADEQGREAYHNALKPAYAKHMKEVSLKAKQEELAKLSSEIESINNL